MASITIMFTDGKYGVTNYTYKMDDKDLQRLYESAAIFKGAGEAYLERSEGHIDHDIVNTVTADLADMFITSVINKIKNTEYANIVDSAKNSIKEVNITLVG